MKTAHKFRRRRPSEKWPNGPRFVVGSVTGTRITQAASKSGHNGRPMPVMWYVHDAAYCYRVVHEGFIETTARKLARQMNKEDRHA